MNEHYKKISTNYQKHTNPNPLRTFFIKNFTKTLLSNIDKENIKILEIGCGEGFVAKDLKTKNNKIKYFGFDLEEGAVEIARQIEKSSIFTSLDLLNLKEKDLVNNFNETKFDAILCLEVLEHIKEYEKALKIIQNLDAKKFIFSVPNEPFFRGSNLLAMKNIKSLGNDIGHVNNWNFIEFKKLINKYFDIKKAQYPYPWQMLICKKKD